MITRNWYNMFKAFNGQKVITDGLTSVAGVASNAGFPYNTPPQGITFVVTSYTKSATSAGIALGSGTTPATIDDYKLESMITSGLSVSVARSYDEDNDVIFNLTITNTSANDITIGEVGMITYSNTSANSGTLYVLTERTVLDSPVTIPAGGIGKIEYSIKLIIPEE